MAITPLSVQLADKIELEVRERQSKVSKEADDSSTILEKMRKSVDLQKKLGLGNSSKALKIHEEALKVKTREIEAEKLAQKFQPVKEPPKEFFPRFTISSGNWQAGNRPAAVLRGRLPLLVMAQLSGTADAIHLTLQNSNGPVTYFEAPIPIMPLTALELAARAKKLAPSAEFHLLFMPSWEQVPQRDPVLLAHIPGTDEYFKIAQWDGDVALIEEFLEDK